MVMQIAWGVFFGFLFLAIFVGIILFIAYIFGKKAEEIPHFIEEPRKRKKTTIQDWWDRYDDDEDWN